MRRLGGWILSALALAVALVAIALPSTAGAQGSACPCTVFAPDEAPSGDALEDSPIEVGMRFRASEDGYITALRFYKQPNNTGTHVGHLWSGTGQKLAEVEFTGETASGWQEAPLADPVAITKDTTYVTSYWAASGRFGFSPGYFNAAHDRPPLQGLASGLDGGNGVYHYGSSAFPTDSWNATNYWVDAVFETTPPPDTRAPRVSTTSPADGATGVPLSSTVAATFDEPLDPATVTGDTFTLRAADGAAVPATVAYDAASRTATLTPSAPLAGGGAYTATVSGGASGVADVAGNRLAADHAWSFTGPPACPCHVFGPTDAPLGDATQDLPLEVGMKFRSSEDGFITALRFYKQPGNTGTHIGHLWTADGQQLAEARFTNETPSGWQEVQLATPVAIAKDTTYITSYHSSEGRFAFDPGFFWHTVGSGPLHAPSAAAVGGNGVYRYGSGGFPTETWNSTNYWVDATFERTVSGDARPPAVASTTPVADAADVPAGAKVTATFDEPLDPLTVTEASLTLATAGGAPVVGQVAYDAATMTATLTPSEPLAMGQTYTATVKSGSEGVTDAGGNRLAADHTWSFRTSPPCPCTVFAPTDAPDGEAVSDQPVEVGMKFRAGEDGFVTALRFYKQANNTGTHVGHLWSGTGQLLASRTFANETASGWQQVELPNPVPITKDTTYVVSYHAGAGRYAFTPGFFGNGVDRGPMHGLANGVDGGNGVYRYGAAAFPTETFNATNYWVDASFERTIPADVRGPAVTELAPAPGAAGVARGVVVSATFDEPLDPASVTADNVTLRDPDGTLVEAAVSYDAQTHRVILDPEAPLAYDTRHTARLRGGPGGLADVAGNPLAEDRTWTFETGGPAPGDGPGGPILVVADPADPFSRYYAEILRAEGLNAFSVADGVTEALLADKTVVIVASPVSDADTALLTSWVEGGGNLIAMRPDQRLAGLLGLAPATGTLANAYLKVDTATSAGAGIEGMTMQFHGVADRWTASAAQPIATLYADAATATPNPAVTLRDVGAAGGQAAAFAYDLARSVVYTRQGNPAWSGQKRDGTFGGSRAIDLFYGAKAGDVQPDWVDLSRIAVPQADEQQRLLANLIVQMTRDSVPLPRFWYLPRGEKAAVVLTGDDHARNGTGAFFDRLRETSPPGCSVADWECPRATSYIYPDTPIGDAEAAAYQADGFEIALHLNTGCADVTAASLDAQLTSQLGAMAAAFPSVAPSRSNRTHCVIWSDWATEAKGQLAHGIRFDTNYYYNGPAGWLTTPGLLTGSGFPMRFADLDGSIVDVYQAMTQVTDESDIANPAQLHALLDGALGPKSYYGVFTLNTHADHGDHNNANDMVSEALDRGVPVVSSMQMLDWLDGRNGSSFAGIAYEAGRLSFSVVTNAKARGAEAMLPARSASGALTKLTRDGRVASWSRRTVKGIDYVVFDATAGAYVATYAADTTPPDIADVTATADGEGNATVAWTTDEPSTSLVEYGRTADNLGFEASETAEVTDHRVELTGLVPATTYRFRVTSTDAAGNAASSPAGLDAPATLTTPAGAVGDSRTADFAGGQMSGTFAGATLAGLDGELQLQPAVGEEFEGAALPAGWGVSPLNPGGLATVSGGALVPDSAAVRPESMYEPPAVLEFAATFESVNDQGVGFGNELTDFPYAAFTTGASGTAIRLYASSGADPASQQDTPLPGVTLHQPHRFRIEWHADRVVFFVDGAEVATHAVTIPGPMRPVASDYRLFGASVQVHWVRQSPYAGSGTFTSRPLDGGPAGPAWQTLTATARVPAGTDVTFETRTGGTPQPDAGWSAWQPVAAAGAVASPPGRYIQYRATLSTTAPTLTPVVERVRIDAGASDNRAPDAGAVTIAPASPRTTQTITATPSGFADPDGDPLTYHFKWLRNGTPLTGATDATLDLSGAGNGDRGDTIRVRVFASDGRGAATDAVSATVTVANTAPTAGSVAVQPAEPSTNDVVRAVATGFADADGDTLGYRYQWLRNGAEIAGATSRTLDLAEPGNGDLGDDISVEVRAVDGNGGTSPSVAGARTITGTNASPVEGTVAISPASPGTAQTLTATRSGFRDPDGDPIEYRYQWFRNGSAMAGETTPTLDLAVPGNGDRGDRLRVEVSAVDDHGASSDTVADAVTVVNTAPEAGTVAIRPNAPSPDDVVSAAVRDFRDGDGDALTYEYQWFRNGTAIGGATARSLNLARIAGVALGDVLEVSVRALDGNGAATDPVRAGATVSSTSSHAVASWGFEEAAGGIAADESGTSDGTLRGGVARTDTGRFGRALRFDGTDDVVTVPDDPNLRLTTGMTLEAWVRPTAVTDWRTVLFRESTGGLAYALYSDGDGRTPSVHIGVDGDTDARGATPLRPGVWSHVAASYDGSTLRFFVDGEQVGTRAIEGAMPEGAGPLTMGANAVWGEHFTGLIDEVRIYNRALTAADIAADMTRPVVEGTPAPPDDITPQAIGRFAAPSSWPVVAVHLALTSTGKVVAWDGFEAATNSEREWDPATGAFRSIPNGRNLFCAGQVTLDDGRLLVVGGHIQAYEGLKDTNLFDPSAGDWTRGEDMTRARWYPTATALPDGRVLVASGDGITRDEPGVITPLKSASNTLPEIYDPDKDSWTQLPAAARRMPLYPFLFVLPDGRVFDAGPDTTTRTLDLASGEWTTVGTSPVEGQSAVMYRPGKIMKSGTWAEPEFPGLDVTNEAAAIDFGDATPAWRSVAPMNYPRAYHTLTMLPDGTVLATGGQAATDGVDEKTGVLAAEIWDPVADRWTTMDSTRRPRLYHSSALLLPDGRVLLAGGGAFGNATDEKSAEIYSPPYLFKGPRPTITSAPGALRYGQSYNLETPDAGRIASASLMKLGAVTHGVDMEQRFIPLPMQAGAGHVSIDAPANANVAPPGWYMVFLVDDAGVPSVAEIVYVDGARDSSAPTAPSQLTATAGADGVTLSWSAASDDVGVDEYRVYRSSTPDFKPSGTTRVARVRSGTTYTDADPPLGRSYYKVAAADAAGNVSAAAGPAEAVVAGDVTPPTVAVTAPAPGATLSGVVAVTADAADGVAVHDVQLMIDGAPAGTADTAEPYELRWDTRTVADGTHTLTAVATDAAGNTATSAQVTVAVANAGAPPGLVAAYGFEDAGGSTAIDSAGDHDGVIAGPVPAADGRFGSALAFDGADDSVTVPDAPGLNPDSGLTVESWVRPAKLGGWRPVVAKEGAPAPAYGLYAGDVADSPAARLLLGQELTLGAAPSLPLGGWSHLAMTWDGAQLRLYVDGTLVNARIAAGSPGAAPGVLRIGGDSVLGEWFEGLVDEVRVYSRPLTPEEIRADMTQPVVP